MAGLRVFPGLKRKLPGCHSDIMETSDPHFSNPADLLSSKRSRLITHRAVSREDNRTRSSSDASCMEVVKHSSPMVSSKSPCAVEGCLSKGFAGLFSSRSYMQFDRERRVSYT